MIIAKRKKKKGFTLIFVIVAFSIISGLLLHSFVLYNNNMKDSYMLLSLMKESSDRDSVVELALSQKLKEVEEFKTLLTTELESRSDMSDAKKLYEWKRRYYIFIGGDCTEVYSDRYTMGKNLPTLTDNVGGVTILYDLPGLTISKGKFIFNTFNFCVIDASYAL